MGVTISSITLTGFEYTFLYDNLQYAVCIHAIFAPPEFLNIYPQNAVLNGQMPKSEKNGTWSFCQFNLLDINYTINPTVYLAGFTAFQQPADQNQAIYIDLNITGIGTYINSSMQLGFDCTLHYTPINQHSIMRIQYIPFNCSLTMNTKNFTNTTGNYCECVLGYYFVDYTQLCQQCSPLCFACSYRLDNCTQCGVNQTLISNSEPQTCQCNSTYYLTSGTDCQPYADSCVDCIDTLTKCTSCGQHQTLNNYTCTCNDGYYLISGTSCAKCDYTCKTCAKLADMCTTCGTNTNLIDNSCDCKPGTFRGVGPDCLTCDTSCLQCESLSLCTSCSNGYYLDGVLCPKCDVNCLTCEEESKQCQTCRANASLDENNKCTCNQGYYMDTSENCQECDPSCMNCQGPLNSQCTECQSGKKLINNQCVCPDGQYLDQEGNCQDCDEECDTCSDDSSCLTCKPNLDNYFSEGQCLSCKEKAAMTVDICKYADCTDQVWTKGEQCDDGNDIDRDGCSNCSIDSNYKCINALLQKSFCYTCPKGCEQCVLEQQNLVLCKQCLTRYYLSNGQCSSCSKNCVTCSSFSQCLTCLVLGYYPTSNGVCPQCEDNAGFYTVINQCQTKCGDSVIAGNEICDDGNLLNGDGCAQNCTLEYGYILQNGKPFQVPVPDSSVTYVNSTTLTNFTVNTGLSDPALCSFMNVQIENYNASAYNYTVSVLQLSDQISCLVSFNFNESITSTQLIHFQVPYTIPSSRRYLEYLYREIIITPRNIIVYSQQQAAQAQSVQSTSGTFTLMLYFIGPGTVLLGGFECFFRILDILAWINNLYFINIQYPLNVGVFFQNSGWASVQLIPQFTKFNQPNDPYYTETPSKFMDLGVDPLFINNAYQSISIIVVILMCHVLTRIIHKVIKFVVSKFMQDNQAQNNSYINIMLNKIQSFNQNIISHLIQGLNLAFLDLVLAIVMQIKYFRTNYIEFYPVLMSTILAFFSIIFISYILIISTQVSNKHYKQLAAKNYKNKYGVLFEDINKRSRLALKYCVFNLLRKTLFIINLIIFYDTPLLQTSFSCIISLINLILILYENPFDSRKALISNFVPDFCIFGLMLISSFLALDDQISQLTADMRFMIGWVMLGLIAISILIQLFYVFQSFIERSQIIYKAITK